ncbi:hypothetical protein AX17_001421 [Amanita inopinata Kibby_2008]|nr:hypothetical protein AX17_001421 [Amanita inopinata Kibby_2008]
MAAFWQPYYGHAPTNHHPYTPFYGGQAFLPPQYPAFPMPPMMHVPGGLTSTSSKWPALNSLLAIDDTLVRFDVRKHPREAIMSNTYEMYGRQPAIVTNAPVTQMRLYSKSFPWCIEITLNRPITCRDVWDALHDGLHQEIDDSEWGMIVRDKKMREMVEKAAKKRMEKDKSSKKLKRIDFLGDGAMFKGLERDEEYEKDKQANSSRLSEWYHSSVPVSIPCNQKIIGCATLMRSAAFSSALGCSDVVKKPKLDQHWSRCHGGFDCIDCSTSFKSPAEWKGHTSCITEAEKYQKSLYKGPKTGQQQGAYRGNAAGINGGRGRGRGRGAGPANRGGRGGGQGNRGLPYAATGSNNTPLGSPYREFGASPIQDESTENGTEEGVMKENTAELNEEVAKPEAGAKDDKKTKRKSRVDELTSDTSGKPASKKAKVEKENGVVEETSKGKKGKKEKKLKEERIEDREGADEKAAKKSRKNRKSDKVIADGSLTEGTQETTQEVAADVPSEQTKESKKRKKDKKDKNVASDGISAGAMETEKSEAGAVIETVEGEKKKKRKKGEAGAVTTSDEGDKKGKSKKSKRDEGQRDVEAGDICGAKAQDSEKSKSKRKRSGDTSREETELNGKVKKGKEDS